MSIWELRITLLPHCTIMFRGIPVTFEHHTIFITQSNLNACVLFRKWFICQVLLLKVLLCLKQTTFKNLQYNLRRQERFYPEKSVVSSNVKLVHCLAFQTKLSECLTCTNFFWVTVFEICWSGTDLFDCFTPENFLARKKNIQMKTLLLIVIHNIRLYLLKGSNESYKHS